MMFLNCPAYLNRGGAVRCWLPAEVRCRFTMRSTDGPLESVMIRCPDRAFRKGGRKMIAWVGRRLRLAVRTVIGAVRMANNEQVYMWECLLLTTGTVPLTATGPLRWVRSLDGYRLVGSHLPIQDPSETRP